MRELELAKGEGRTYLEPGEMASWSCPECEASRQLYCMNIKGSGGGGVPLPSIRGWFTGRQLVVRAIGLALPRRSIKFRAEVRLMPRVAFLSSGLARATS